MPSILSKDELKNRLEIVYDKKVTNREARKIRQHNINSFSTIIKQNKVTILNSWLLGVYNYEENSCKSNYN